MLTSNPTRLSAGGNSGKRALLPGAPLCATVRTPSHQIEYQDDEVANLLLFAIFELDVQ